MYMHYTVIELLVKKKGAVVLLWLPNTTQIKNSSNNLLKNELAFVDTILEEIY